MDRLAVLEKGDVRWSIGLRGQLRIGRDASNDFQISDSKVSRQHCLIERNGDEVILRDLGSSNGTYVNGKRVSEVSLSPGDRILLGTTELVFEHIEGSFEEGKQDLAVPADGVYRVKGVKSFFRDGVTPDSFRRTVERLSTLFEIGNIINTSRDSASLMRAILRQIVRIIEADRYYLLLRNEKTDALEVAAVHPEQENGQGEFPKVSRTIIHAALHEGTSVLSVDTPHDMRFSGAKSVILYDINSVMCVPLRSHEKILGVIQVDSRDPTRFYTKEDLNFLTAIGISAGIAIENITLYENLKRLFRSTVKSLVAALEANDPYTGGHSIRVAEYSKQLAECLGLSGQEVEKIELAAFLHDIGKIGIPNEVLNKPGRFSTMEFQVMRDHPSIGYEILSRVEGMEEIAQIVRHHHERFDGSGYPDGLSGEEIPLGSRILGVVDTFDAVTTDRPYRKRRDFQSALEEISRFSGSQFDPELVKVLRSCLLERQGNNG